MEVWRSLSKCEEKTRSSSLLFREEYTAVCVRLTASASLRAVLFRLNTIAVGEFELVGDVGGAPQAAGPRARCSGAEGTGEDSCNVGRALWEAGISPPAKLDVCDCSVLKVVETLGEMGRVEADMVDVVELEERAPRWWEARGGG